MMASENKAGKLSRGGRAAILFSLLFGICGLGVAGLTYYHQSEETIAEAHTDIDSLLTNDYYPLSEAMEAAGFVTYKKSDPGSYVKTIYGTTVTILFDFETNLCDKKGYSFNLDGQWVEHDTKYYVKKSVLESATGYTFSYDESHAVSATKAALEAGEWRTAYAPLIAHAGGALRKAHSNQTYTNGLYALVQNYDLGLRVFEIDFYQTADGNLAAVHTGMVPEEENAIAMTASEWKQYTGIGSVGTMLIGDVLDQMVINEDLYIITDTKLYDTAAFKLIYEEAAKRDVVLLDRIIPQIYSTDMYDELMEVYEFPSIIFATYAASTAQETIDEVIALCTEKENIDAATVNFEDERSMSAYLAGFGGTDVAIYAHTLNDYDGMTKQLNRGAHGVLTDLLLPRDYEVYAALQQ